MTEAASQAAGQATDIEEILDHRFGAWRWFVFALCGLAMAIEGFDMYMLGAIVPALADGLGVGPPAIAAVFIAQGIGLALGYTFIAPVADRVGRRPIILICVLGFAISTLLTTLVSTLGTVAFLRFIAFTFFGGIMPNIISLVAELAPRRVRARQIILANACFALGAALGGALSPALVSTFGWWGPFLAGGVAPLLLLPFLFLLLPESPRFMIIMNRPVDQVNRVLRRITPDADAVQRYFVDEPVAQKASFKAVFMEGRLAMTLLFMLAGAMIVFATNMIASWAPTIWHLQAGFSMADAAKIFALSSIGGIVWPLVMIQLINWLGLKRALVLCFTLGGCAMLIYMVQPFTPMLAGIMAVTFGAFVIGGMSGLYALISAAYPTQMRSTALGVTAGVSRLLAIVGPATGGLLLAKNVSPTGMALAFAVPLFVAAGAIILVKSKARD